MEKERLRQFRIERLRWEVKRLVKELDEIDMARVRKAKQLMHTEEWLEDLGKS